MDFKIAHHTGSRHDAPEGSLELLFEQLGARRGLASFRLQPGQINATWRGDAPVSSTQDERLEIGRRAILELVLKACRAVPELDSDWFAISPRR